MRRAYWYYGAVVVRTLGGDGIATPAGLPDTGQCQWQGAYTFGDWRPKVGGSPENVWVRFIAQAHK